MKHLYQHCTCPICGVVIHKTRPLEMIRWGNDWFYRMSVNTMRYESNYAVQCCAVQCSCMVVMRQCNDMHKIQNRLLYHILLCRNCCKICLWKIIPSLFSSVRLYVLLDMIRRCRIWCTNLFRVSSGRRCREEERFIPHILSQVTSDIVPAHNATHIHYNLLTIFIHWKWKLDFKLDF